MVRIQYRPSPKEHIVLYVIAFLAFLLVKCAVAGLLLYYFVRQENLINWLMSFMIIEAVSSLMWLFALSLRLFLNRKQFEYDVEYLITKNKIIYSSRSGFKSEFQWDLVKRVRDIKSGFFFDWKLARSPIQYVPKAPFTTESLQEFRDIVKGKGLLK